MKLYTYSTARQRLAEVLEEASREGEVQIRRQDGRVYAVTPVAQSAQSPFANVTGRAVKGVTSKDLLRTVREEGWARGARALRSARRSSAAQRKEARGLETHSERQELNSGARRPFHAEYAWAFDILIDRPVRKECAVIAAWLVGLDIPPGAEVLDAGCGTGRYSIELARRGYIVHGVDLSPELIEVVLPFGSNFDVPRCPLRYRM